MNEILTQEGVYERALQSARQCAAREGISEDEFWHQVAEEWNELTGMGDG